MQQKDMKPGVDYACAIHWGSRGPTGKIVYHKLTRVRVTELGIGRYGRPHIGRGSGRYVKGETADGPILVAARDVIGEWAKLAEEIARSQVAANDRKAEDEAAEARAMELTQRFEQLTGVMVIGRGGGRDRRGLARNVQFVIDGADDLEKVVEQLAAYEAHVDADEQEARYG